jgi:glycosyltransferase involved in cell wall biosynthesis
MRDRGHQVRIFCPDLTARAQHLGDLDLEVLPISSLHRAAGADVLHAHGFKAGGYALPVAKIIRAPLVVTWHNAVLGSGRSARTARVLQRLVARGADLTLGASSDLVAEAVRMGARRARLAPVAAPALPVATVSREDERAQLGLSADDLLVLTVSRLAPQKNLGMLADVAAAVRDRVDLHFVVVGEGPERSALERRIAHDGSRIRLLGHRDDMPSLLHAADLALLTSTWEARALVAQEALLSGLPLVSTRVGGIEELVGDAAVLVEPGDAAGTARRLIALADDPQERARLASASLRQAAGWPDEDDVVEDLLAGYAAVRTRR